jgi:hypothetical protein
VRTLRAVEFKIRREVRTQYREEADLTNPYQVGTLESIAWHNEANVIRHESNRSV